MEKGTLKKGWIIILLVMTSFGFGGPQDWDLKAILVPDNPTINDPISILSSAITVSGAVTIDDSILLITGTDILLDLFLKVGSYQVVTPWSYTENIGNLPAGIYDLTVTANYDYYASGHASQEYFTSFEVVIPEPASILLFGFMGMLLRRKMR